MESFNFPNLLDGSWRVLWKWSSSDFSRVSRTSKEFERDSWIWSLKDLVVKVEVVKEVRSWIMFSLFRLVKIVFMKDSLWK